jgi:hypothetical protein
MVVRKRNINPRMEFSTTAAKEGKVGRLEYRQGTPSAAGKTASVAGEVRVAKQIKISSRLRNFFHRKFGMNKKTQVRMKFSNENMKTGTKVTMARSDLSTAMKSIITTARETLGLKFTDEERARFDLKFDGGMNEAMAAKKSQAAAVRDKVEALMEEFMPKNVLLKPPTTTEPELAATPVPTPKLAATPISTQTESEPAATPISTQTEPELAATPVPTPKLAATPISTQTEPELAATPVPTPKLAATPISTQTESEPAATPISTQTDVDPVPTAEPASVATIATPEAPIPEYSDLTYNAAFTTTMDALKDLQQEAIDTKDESLLEFTKSIGKKHEAKMKGRDYQVAGTAGALGQVHLADAADTLADGAVKVVDDVASGISDAAEEAGEKLADAFAGGLKSLFGVNLIKGEENTSTEPAPKEMRPNTMHKMGFQEFRATIGTITPEQAQNPKIQRFFQQFEAIQEGITEEAY